MTGARRPLAGGWVVSFLDLFSCALGGVLLLLILTASDRPPPGTGDRPAAAFSMVIQFAPNDAPDDDWDKVIEIPKSLPIGVVIKPDPRWRRSDGYPGLLVVTGYLTDQAPEKIGSPIVLKLKRKPMAEGIEVISNDAATPKRHSLLPGQSLSLTSRRFEIQLQGTN